jgi:hypothetical protein
MGSERDIADVTAPTSEWRIYADADTLDLCEIRLAEVSKYTTADVARLLSAVDQPTDRHLSRLQLRFAASRCVHDEGDVRGDEWRRLTPEDGYHLPLE